MAIATRTRTKLMVGCLAAWAALFLPMPMSCPSTTAQESQGLPGSRLGRERELVTLPLEFDVRPDIRFYFLGERVYHVRLEQGPGDTLLVNGVKIPFPPSEWNWGEMPSEDDLLRVYGRVPFFKTLIAAGKSPGEAADLFSAETTRLRRSAQRTFQECMKAGESRAEAVEAAVSRMRELDVRGIIKWETVRTREDFMEFKVRGIAGWECVTFEMPVRSELPATPRRRSPRLLATQLYEELALFPGPCWYILSYGEALCHLRGAEVVAEAERQLQTAMETGSVPPHPVTRALLREIIEKHQQAGSESDLSPVDEQQEGDGDDDSAPSN